MDLFPDREARVSEDESLSKDEIAERDFEAASLSVGVRISGRNSGSKDSDYR
jgi:hypothetical protein